MLKAITAAGKFVKLKDLKGFINKLKNKKNLTTKDKKDIKKAESFLEDNKFDSSISPDAMMRMKKGGEIKPKKKPLSPRQKALIDSANRIRKLEAEEERTKGIAPKVKPKKPIVPKKKPKLANGGLVSGKAQAKKYFTGVF